MPPTLESVIPDPEPHPDRLAEVFGRHPAVHPYGLADLEEPFWSQSRWYAEGEAVVGVLELDDADVAIVYCVSATAEAETLDLLGRLAAAGALPAHSFLTGPIGVASKLAEHFEVRWCTPHTRMRLTEAASVPTSPVQGADAVVPVGRAEIELIDQLFAVTPDAGRFFTESMLDTDAYVGTLLGGELVALAGVHVLSDRYRVAAIGNVLTRHDQRRRGHAARLVTALCAQLAHRVDVIGLNVNDENVGARRLYDSLGFEPVIAFDEGEFVAR